MAALRYFRYLYQAFLSKPEHERTFYRQIRKAAAGKTASPVTQIVEIGVGNAQRAERLIRFAQQYAESATIEYTGIDMFEGRPDQDGLSLKEAHKVLSNTGAKIKLVPGDAMMALPRVANGLANSDLLIISADQERSGIEMAWSWIPRMLHEQSRMYWESETEGKKEDETSYKFEVLDLYKVESQADTSQKRAA